MAGYGSDAGLAAWAADSGYTVATGITSAQARQRGSAYVDGLYERRFPGDRVLGIAQERAWPRTGASDRSGVAISESTVPSIVEYASYFAALQELASPGILAASVAPGKITKREKVDGAVEREFFGKGDTTEELLAAQQTLYSYIENILWPILVSEDQPAVLVV